MPLAIVERGDEVLVRLHQTRNLLELVVGAATAPWRDFQISVNSVTSIAGEEA